MSQGVHTQEDIYEQERLKGEMAGIAYVETLLNGQELENQREQLKLELERRDQEIEDGYTG